MVPGIINGKDAIFLVDEGDGYVPFVCAKDLSIETTAGHVPTATLGDGAWAKFAYQDLSYSITMNGVATIDDTRFSTFNINNYLINFLELPFKIHFIDQDGLFEKTIKGSALVERCAISANTGQLVLGDISLKGNGAYQMIECDALIGSMMASFPGGGTVQVALSDVTGDPVSFFYQLDNGLQQETTLTTFNLLSVPGGYHKLIVIPVCASGYRGEEALLEFSNFGVVPNPACGMPTGVSITNVSYSGFRVNWTYGLANTGVTIRVQNSTTGLPMFYTASGSFKDITNLVPGTQYNITIYGNCGATEESQRAGLVATTLTSGSLPTLTIRNFTTSITISQIQINGVVVRSTPVEPNTEVTEIVSAGLSDIEVFYGHVGSDDASIKVVTASQMDCQGVVSNGIGSNVYTAISIPTTGIEINVNPNLC